MKLISLCILVKLSTADGDDEAVSHSGKGGLSVSISKTSTKESPEVQTDEITDTSITRKSIKKSTESSPNIAEVLKTDTESSTSTAVSSTNRSDIPQSIDDSSTRSLNIAHQTHLFFENLQQVALNVSELSLEGMNAAVHLRVLSSYVDLMVKALEHLETLESEERRHYGLLKDTITELTEYVTVDALEQSGKPKNKTITETLEITEETNVKNPVPRSMLEVSAATAEKIKSEIQEKVSHMKEKAQSAKGRVLIEVDLNSPAPSARSMIEVGLNGVRTEEIHKTESTRIVRRPAPRTVQKTTNINIDVKGIFKKVKAMNEGGGGSSGHHQTTHVHQQHVHYQPVAAHSGCVTCMHRQYASYYGAYR